MRRPGRAISVRDHEPLFLMRDDYLLAAHAVISDPYILINVVSRRVKQLRRGARPLVESLEKLKLEDIALREIAEGKIGYELLYERPEAGSANYQARLDARALPAVESVRVLPVREP